MFREHHSNTNVFADECGQGRGQIEGPHSKPGKPIFRTLEPRMVFDAAAALAVEHAAQAPAHHEPVRDAGQPLTVNPTWSHLGEALKSVPVTPVDKPQGAENPAPVDSAGLGDARGTEADGHIPKTGGHAEGEVGRTSTVNEIFPENSQPGTKPGAGDGTDIVAEKASLPAHGKVAGGAEGVPVDWSHLPAVPKAADTHINHFAAADRPDARSLDHDLIASHPRAIDDGAVEAGSRAAPGEVFFVWDNVKDWQQITTKLSDTARVYVLDSSKDGVNQIAAILKGERDVGAIHLVSHGAEGSLNLGTAVLDADTMQGQYYDELTAIGRSLSRDGDILIYGCDFAAGDDGLQTTVILGGITGADVAASNDLTGAAALGGDWDLEQRTGAIETHVFADYAYQRLLAAPTVDLDGTLGSTGNFEVSYGENASPVAIVADGPVGATIVDSDGDLQSITITADVAPNGNAEHLSFGGLAIGLGSDSTNTVVVGATTYSIVFTAATRTFTITNNTGGAIPGGSDTNALVRSITYDNGSDDPTNGGTNNDRIFSFTATDATSVTSAAATVTIAAVNDAPVGVDDNSTVAEDGIATGNVLTNDTDVDGGSLAVTQFVVGGTTYLAGQTANISGVGTLEIDGDGSYTFTPVANYDGLVPVATYTVSDGALSSTATLTVTITPVNDAPVDGDETNSTGEDTTLTVGNGAAGDLLDNATDVEGGTLTVAAFSVAGESGSFVIGSAYTIVGVGDITINADGSYVFAPAADYAGAVPVITYTVSDGTGGTDTSTLTLTIALANDAPEGTDSTATITEDTAYTFSAGSFGFTDPVDTPANALEAVIIATLPPTAEGTLFLSGVAVTAGQTIALVDIPNLTFQPVADVESNGVGSFTFQVVDNGGLANGGQDTDQSPNTFAFNITAVNDAPVATDDTAATPEDTTLSAAAGSGLLSNDTDVDGDTLTITQFTVSGITAAAGQTGTIPGVGQLTINADGSYTFIPAANFTGLVPVITYTISDGHGGTDTATFVIEVISVNDPPVDGDENNTVTEDTTLSVADGTAGDLLNNASDLDGDTLTITDFTVAGEAGPFAVGTGYLITGVGTITINANGSYSFVPVANYDGTIPVIIYTVSDGALGSDTSTLTLTMSPVNDPPVAQDDAATTPENTPVSGNVLSNDTDIDDPTLTVTFFEIDGQTYGAGTTATIAGVGTLLISTDGSYVFTPAPSYDGPVPEAIYTVSDGETTDTAVLRLTITPLNDAPVADDETGTTAEDTTLSVPAASGLLVGDTDVDGDPLTVTGFEVGGTSYAAGDTATIAGVGALTINADGSYEFVPVANYNGPVPGVTYTVSDSNGATDQGALALTVTPVNDAPVAVDDTGSTPEDTPLTGDILANDTDVDGDQLTIIGFEVAGIPGGFIAGSTATIPGVGTVTINPDGTYTLVPAPNYSGSVPDITYVVSDGNGGTATGTVTLDVVPVNDPPVANDDAATTPMGTTVNGDVLANDTDVDGDTLAVTGFEVGGTTYAPGQTATIPGVGDVTLNSDGSYTFEPDPGYTGPVPDITYTVSDGTASDDGTLAIDVIPPNSVGANNDTATTPEDTTLIGDVLANDLDPNGEDLSVVSFTVTGDATVHAAGSSATITGVGVLTINVDGTYTFVPALNYFGPVPVVTYTATDGTLSDTAALTITVTPVNDLPVAVNDTGTTPEDTPLAGNVLTNDTDIDGNMLSVTGFVVAGVNFASGQTANIPLVGRLTINANGSYSFVPAVDYDGAVPVATYTVSDGSGGVATATFTISITPVNDAPVATDDTGTTPEDTTLAVSAPGLLSNDTDVDGNVLEVASFTIAGVPGSFTAGSAATITGSGVLTINADGSYNFVPVADFNGSVPVVTYTVTDGTLTDTATLVITVTPVNDAPSAADDTATLAEDTTLTVSAASGLLFNDTDIDANPLSVTQFEVAGIIFGPGTTATIPGVGSLTISANGGYTFTPVANYNGSVLPVTYTVSDGNGGTDTAILQITVTPVNDAPVAVDDGGTTAEDTTLDGDVLPNDTDIDGDTLSVAQFVIAGDATIYAAGATATISGVGQLTIGADGSYTFVPVADYNGPVPVVTYTASDGHGGSDAGTLTIDITPVNDAPLAIDDTGTTPEDTTLTVPAASGLLANDIEVDGDAMIVQGYSVAGISGGFLAGATATISGVGTLRINADGSYVFVPVANYNGPGPVATYRVSDGILTDMGVLTITVTPVDDPPVDGNETNSVTEDTTLTVPATSGLLANTTDIDGGTPVVIGFTVAGEAGPFTVGNGYLIAGVGTITIDTDGSYAFAPDADYAGAIPLVTYTVSDSAGGTDTSTLNLSMVPVNDPPVDGNETNAVTEDTTLTVPTSTGLLANATDIDGGALSISSFTVAGQSGPFSVGSGYLISGVGTITINADGSYVFAPAANYTGAIPVVTYTVIDGSGGTDSSTLTLTMVAVNDPPVDGNETNSVTEDTTLDVPSTSGLLTNSSDIDGGSPTVIGFTVAGEAGPFVVGTGYPVAGVGTVTINVDGSYSFTPAANYTGAIPVVTYTVSDGSGGTDSSTLSLTMVPVNDPPIDGNEVNSVTEDTTLAVAAVSGLLANATDVDGGVLSISAFTVAGEAGPFAIGSGYLIAGVGTLTVNADGSYVFVPTANYAGAIPVISYTISDGAGATDTSTLTLTMVPVNDAPTDGDETNSVNEDTTLAVPASSGLLVNTTDIDGGTPRVSGFAVAGEAGPFPVGTGYLISGVGTLTINSNGSYSFTPAPNYVGAIPVVTYTVSDGAGGTDTSTLSLTMVPLNDPPAVSDDIGTTPEDTVLNGNVLTNDTDVEGDALSLTQFLISGNSTTYSAGDTATIAGVGDLTINADGSYTFAPAMNYFGPVPVVTYTATDGSLTDIGTLTLEVTPVNDPPIASDDTGTTPEDTVLNGNVLANDADIDGALLTVMQFTIDGTTYAAGQTATIPGVGALTIRHNGDYAFAPDANYNGPVPDARYTVADGRGGADSAILSIAITPVNDAPGPGDGSGGVGGALVPNQTSIDSTTVPLVDLSGYFFDVDGDVLTYSGSGLPPGLSIDAVTGVIGGTLPHDASQASPYVVVVTATDPSGLSATQTFRWTITNPAPIADNDVASVPEDTVLNGAVLANDSDPDGDFLTVSQFVIGGATYAAGETAVLAGVGSLVIHADGSYRFAPAADYNGSVPAATYTLRDGDGRTDTATLTITVTPVNDAPDVVDDQASGNEDTPITGNVLDNDSDPDDDPLVVTGFSVEGDPTTYLPGETAAISGVGTITMNSNGDFVFSPAPNYDGPVPDINYTASDGNGGAGQATLTITIDPIDDFVPTPDENQMELPGIVEDGFAPVEADGAVLDTVDLLGSLNRIADITGRHADSPPTLSLTTFLGGSSTIVISVPGGDERVHVETIKHTGIIYLQIIEEMEGEGDKSVLSFRLRAAEGTPSIEWLRQIGPLTFAGYPDPMAGRVDLVLSITRSDGRVSDYELQLDAPSARLSQPWPSGDHGFQDGKAPLFGDQMNERSRSHEALERALGFR